MWKLDLKEGWAPKNWCFWWCWRRLLRVPWTAEINPVNPKGDQSWIFIGRTDAKALIFLPLDAKSRLIGKYPATGKDWRQEEKGTTEDEMVGWHHWLNGHEFEQAPGDGEGQGGLACCCPWSCSQARLSNWTTTTVKIKTASLSLIFLQPFFVLCLAVLCCPVLCLVAQLYPTPCDPMGCILPGSFVHGDSPGKNTGVGCHALLQGIFPVQGSNPGILSYRWILYRLSHQGSLVCEYVVKILCSKLS